MVAEGGSTRQEVRSERRTWRIGEANGMSRIRIASESAHRIASVEVEELFGLHTYKIAVTDADGAAGKPSLLVLYGDNGTGKTTILQLIYHLLGKEDNRGHRTYLAKVPFRRVRVALRPGVTVEAFRDEGRLVGSFKLRISHPVEPAIEAEALVDKDLAVRSLSSGTGKQREAWRSLLQGLESLNLRFFLLTDDRRSDQAPELMTVHSEESDQDVFIGRVVHRDSRAESENPGLRLERIVDRLEAWIRDEALEGANVGEAGTHTVYADIAKRIAHSQRPGEPVEAVSDDLVESLVALETRSRPYAALGLVSPPNLGDIVGVLTSSPSATRQLVANVVAPYVDSLRARLDALQDIQELVTLFLERLNSFFSNKSVSYVLARGLSIVSAQGDMLRPSQLSSGERQLLALLSQVVIARRSASVFLIDEPEISLNVKWQRILVDTLLELVEGTDVQFILATHSLELLATHRSHVHRLGADR
jgi:energy-coupling factor transporter ATP-binding protein EcfA2